MSNPYYYSNNNSYGIKVDDAEALRVRRQTESFFVTVAVSLSFFFQPLTHPTKVGGMYHDKETSLEIAETRQPSSPECCASSAGFGVSVLLFAVIQLRSWQLLSFARAHHFQR